MPQIIASTYEILGELGSGGGGVVYLARHLRLDKKVVLKADKRTLAAKPEVLRREVDALKNLSHTYIPQVYDFFMEEEIVYTVMDYIEGESFNKPLKRGQRFAQAQVIEWACQLLDALVYLHGRPPHGILHADIKPANVMLTPQGDVRLIDFNIALALGEEGAVAVGRSFGYASPEHYGLDYSSSNATQNVTDTPLTKLTDNITTVVDEEQNVQASSSSAESTSGKRTIMLDVRSDIYSLGATLYHIMTGERPTQNATEVKPISTNGYSPAVIAIIDKAMNPNPDLRYQTAADMLYAFEHLRENDSRTKRYRRTVTATAAILSVLFLAGGFTAFTGLKQMEQLQNAYALAEYSANSLAAGDVAAAVDFARQALPERRSIFTPPHTAEAQKALAAALGIYDLSDGFKAHQTVELPSAPLFIDISPNGKTGAAVYAYAVAVFDTETAEIIATLPAEHSALSEAKFVDDNTIIYAGDGAIRAYDVANRRELWTGKAATKIDVSADGKIAAAVYKDENVAAIYDIADGRAIAAVPFEDKRQRVIANDSFANPDDNLLALNRDGSLLAASFADGSLMVFDINNSTNNIEIFNGSDFIHFEGGFFEKYFAFSATNNESSAFAVIDTEELAQTGGFEGDRPFSVLTDTSGIYVQTDNILVRLHPETGEQAEIAYTDADIKRFARDDAHTITAMKNAYTFFDANANLLAKHEDIYDTSYVQLADGIAIIGGLDTPVLRIMKLEQHPDAQVFAYDTTYQHDEARVSADGTTVMLFSYNHFRLYNINGRVIIETAIPEAEQVYDQQYRRDENGSRLDVIYNDGTVRVYSATDGKLLSETAGEKPNISLYEEFFTDTLRIESPLHGTPTAYDRNSGKQIRELEKDAYLTYVTQVGENIVTEYISAEGERFGLLLNAQCETLAYLPGLCDIIGEELIFDYGSGYLRKTRVYSIDELLTLANN